MIYILTVVHNNLTATKKMLKCLDIQTMKNFRIVIVDDKSTDGTESFLRNKYPKVITISGDGNLWWTGGLNKGIRYIFHHKEKEDFVLIINNDCQFDKDYVKKLYTSIQKEKKTIVGSLAVSSADENSVWDAGVVIEWEKGIIKALFPVGTNVKDLNKKILQNKIDTMTTKGTLYPIKVFEQIGLFDREHFPHYLSDYEYGIRARRNGWKLVINYNAVLKNDTENSGFDYTNSDPSFSHFINLLFGKRSRVNILDQFNFIRYCCPNEYKLKNYYLLLLRLFFAGKRIYFR